MNGLFRRVSDRVVARLPVREDFERFCRASPIVDRALNPRVWRFTRRSVPRGVALGLFAGFIVPVGQIFLASCLALPIRANLAIAALVTFVTNPFTLPIWVFVANRIGRFVLQGDRVESASALDQMRGEGGDIFIWLAQSAGFAAVGFILLSIIASALGYFASGILWRAWIGRKQRARRERHARAGLGRIAKQPSADVSPA